MRGVDKQIFYPESRAREGESGTWPAVQRAKSLNALVLDGAKVPRLLVSRAEALRAAEDARTRWVLAFIDGLACVDVVIDSCGLPARDATFALVDLVTKHVVGLR
jgi:hypothetical protein